MANLRHLFLIVVCATHMDVQGAPFYSGSYIASGEYKRSEFVVNGIRRDSEVTLFEEVYDSYLKKLAFRATKKEDVITWILDFTNKRNYLVRSHGGVTTCEDIPPGNLTRNEFITLVSAPDERTYFFLRDVLVLKSSAKIQTRIEDVVRGQFSRIHGIHTTDYEVKGTVTWTKPYTSTTYKQQRPPPNVTDLTTAMNIPADTALQVPLQAHFVLQKDVFTSESITMNIFNFDYIGNRFQNTLLEIPDGVRCEGNKKSGLPHPVYYNMRVFRYSARVCCSTSKRHFLVKGFVDVNRQLHRLDYSAWDVASSTPSTVILSGKEGMAYRILRNQTSAVCFAENITEVALDKQMILLPEYMVDLSSKTFFVGKNISATMNYKKPAMKGGIPCHVWDIVRFDWPSDGAKTLWEWCFIDKSYVSPATAASSSQIISLDIHVLEVSNASLLAVKAGETISFHFFDINRAPSQMVELQDFDISSCYPESTLVRNVLLTFKDKAKLDEVYKRPGFRFAAQKVLTNTARIPILHVKAATDWKATLGGIVALRFSLFGNINGTSGIQLDSSIERLQQAFSKKAVKVLYEKVLPRKLHHHHH